MSKHSWVNMGDNYWQLRDGMNDVVAEVKAEYWGDETGQVSLQYLYKGKHYKNKSDLQDILVKANQPNRYTGVPEHDTDPSG